jgi:hypothetical protein
MTIHEFHLAQVNIARLIEPLDSQRLADFVAALDSVNASADLAPGFVWRLKTEEGNATSLSAFEWDLEESSGVLTNMSVWQSYEALREFVFSPLHHEVLRKKKSWFFNVAEATTALWWIPAGTIPTLEDAESKIRYLRKNGPSPLAFDLAAKYSPVQ